MKEIKISVFPKVTIINGDSWQNSDDEEKRAHIESLGIQLHNTNITCTRIEKASPLYHRLIKCEIGDKERRDFILSKAEELKKMDAP